MQTHLLRLLSLLMRETTGPGGHSSLRGTTLEGGEGGGARRTDGDPRRQVGTGEDRRRQVRIQRQREGRQPETEKGVFRRQTSTRCPVRSETR